MRLKVDSVTLGGSWDTVAQGLRSSSCVPEHPTLLPSRLYCQAIKALSNRPALAGLHMYDRIRLQHDGLEIDITSISCRLLGPGLSGLRSLSSS